jgi:DNA-binding NarL/FixJ family response regulator
MNGRPVRVLVVDDQILVRRGIAELLEIEDAIEVVGEAKDGLDALRKIPDLEPEVALVDARMPGMAGVELIQRLADDHPGVAAIVLTTFDDDEYIFGGLRAGAKGYLLKDTPPEELVLAIEKAHRGETVLGDQILARVVSGLRRSSGGEGGGPEEALSGREAEVVGLVGVGATNAEIGKALYISEGTARNHVSKILRKLGLRNRTQLAIFAVERGFAGGRPSGGSN